MSVIQNGDFIHLTGFDALKYEYNTCKGIKGIINAIISFFLGRTITLFEGQSLLSWFAGKHFTLDPYLALVPNQVIKSRI